MASTKTNAAAGEGHGVPEVDLLPGAVDRRNTLTHCYRQARLQYLAGCLHRLGPRPTFEFLKEVAAGADVLDRLEIYARLDPGFVRALGGDALPVMVAIDGGRA